jgi:hypothetical protein
MSVTVKVKVSLCFNWEPRHEGVLGEWWYSFTHSWRRHLMEVSGQLHASGRFTPQGKSPWYPLDRRLGWAPEPVRTRWGREKFAAPAWTRTSDLVHMLKTCRQYVKCVCIFARVISLLLLVWLIKQNIICVNEMRLRPRRGLQTPVSYIVSSGSLSMLEAITQLPGVDINKPDNEGNTPLHFAAQAGKYSSCVRRTQ